MDGQAEDLNLAWLHCNECHRSFEHHNKLHVSRQPTAEANTVGAGQAPLRIVKSDLKFAFTSCGHFYCEQCLKLHSTSEGFDRSSAVRATNGLLFFLLYRRPERQL